jgi:hypothetical protein
MTLGGATLPAALPFALDTLGSGGSVSTTQTITGQACVRVTTLQTINGQASISGGIVSVDRSIFPFYLPATLVKGLTIVSTKTITGQSCVRVTTVKAITGQSSVKRQTVRSIVGYSLITTSAPIVPSLTPAILPFGLVAQLGVKESGSPITSLKTITGQSSILRQTVRSLTGYSFIQNFRTKTITGQSDILVVSVKNINGSADIIATSVQTIQGSGFIVYPIQHIYGFAVIIGTTVQNLNAQSMIAVMTTPPTAPASLTATGTGAAVLVWSPSTDPLGVTAYEIQSAPCGGSPTWTTIATVSGTTLTYTDNPGPGCWQYQIIALNAFGQTSSPSPSASITLTYTTTDQDINGQACISAGSLQVITGQSLIVTSTPSSGFRITQMNRQTYVTPNPNLRITAMNRQVYENHVAKFRVTKIFRMTYIPYLGSYNHSWPGGTQRSQG